MDHTKTKGPPSEVVKRLLLGRAVPSEGLEHTLLPKILALPVFSSDALSSVAYATEEILPCCSSRASPGSAWRCRSPGAIALLLVVVVSSYRQTVRAYPNGGGSYIVSKENLGTWAGLLAAAALLTDYVLTVAVSVVAGVFAMISAVPGLSPHRVELGGRIRRADHAGEPARGQGVGHALRRSHVRVHHLDLHAARRRASANACSPGARW